jgi:hypothetical protein
VTHWYSQRLQGCSLGTRKGVNSISLDATGEAFLFTLGALLDRRPYEHRVKSRTSSAEYVRMMMDKR